MWTVVDERSLKFKTSLNIAKESMLLYLLENDFSIQLGIYNGMHDNKRFNDIISLEINEIKKLYRKS